MCVNVFVICGGPHEHWSDATVHHLCMLAACPGMVQRGRQLTKEYVLGVFVVTCWILLILPLCVLLPRCMQCRRGIVTRFLSVRLSVCPSVRPSVTRVIPDKTEERSVQIFIPYERTFILVCLRRRMVGGERPLLREILGQPTPIGAKSSIFNQ